jgi:sigma-B regulation protein RsbU (phosphoserine phosphatase)
LSNLVANALTHGSRDGPVRVHSVIENGVLSVSVANQGEPIPNDLMDRLFQPFTRDEMRPSQQGLGLGLFIAHEIAQAHGGTLEALSSTHETRFTFQMPVEQDEDVPTR